MADEQISDTPRNALEEAADVALKAAMAYLEDAGYERAQLVVMGAVPKPPDDPDIDKGNSATMLAALGDFDGAGDVFGLVMMCASDLAGAMGVQMMVHKTTTPKRRGQG